MNGTIQLLKFLYLALFSKHYANISDLSSFSFFFFSITILIYSDLRLEVNRDRTNIYNNDRMHLHKTRLGIFHYFSFFFCTYRFDPFMHVTSQYKGNPAMSPFSPLAPALLGFCEFWKEKGGRGETFASSFSYSYSPFHPIGA